MFGGIETWDFVFPNARGLNYNAALQVYNQVKPKRTDGKRPLKAQRTGPYYMNKREGGAIQFIYHSTAVVTLHPNDTIEYDLSYHSRSTAAFADHFAGPARVSYPQDRMWVHIPIGRDQGKWYCTDHAVFDLRTSQMLSGQTRLEAMRVVKEKSKPILARLRPVIDFLSAAVQIDPNYIMKLRRGKSYYDCRNVSYDRHTLDQIDLTDSDSFVDDLLAPLAVQKRKVDTHTALIAHIKRMFYEAYDAYEWVLLPDGSGPPTTDWRVVE